MLNGEDMIARCREKDAQRLRAKLSLLQEKLTETKAKADKRKVEVDGSLWTAYIFKHYTVRFSALRAKNKSPLLSRLLRHALGDLEARCKQGLCSSACKGLEE